MAASSKNIAFISATVGEPRLVFEEPCGDRSEDETAHVRRIRHAAARLRMLRGVTEIHELRQEPHPDQQHRRDVRCPNENEDDEQRADLVAWVGDEKSTQDGCDRTTRS